MRWLLLLSLLIGTFGCSGQSGQESTELDQAPTFEEITKIDVHSHIFRDAPEFVEMMRRSNLKIINICVRGNDLERLQQMEAIAESMHQKYPQQFEFASTFDLTRRNGDSYVSEVNQWLDDSFRAGAVMTKIWKEVGMEMKQPDGSFLMPDDPLFDPIYDHLTERKIPLIAHLAEPIAAWRPLDPESPHYGYYSSHPEWHFYGRDDVPSWEEIIAARDHILEEHPDLNFIGAHLGSMAFDVDEVAKRLDRFPNFNVEVAARTRDLTRQPREKVRNFFIKYQNRIMYGVDLTLEPDPGDGSGPQDMAAYAKDIEERYRNDYRYYAGTDNLEMAGKTVEGLGLPREVLEKFYNRNARRIISNLKF
jgi:predicted TIM-barrel fold metal-dependent hydrolase